MADYIELQKMAAYAAQDTIKFADEDEEMRALQQFHEEVNPETVLALIAENDRLNAENKQLIALECHGGTAEAAINLLAERDQLKAENEALREEIEHSKTNPLYSTRANSRRYVWLRDNHIGDNPDAINLECGPWPGLNSAIDAAMGKGEQS